MKFKNLRLYPIFFHRYNPYPSVYNSVFSPLHPLFSLYLQIIIFNVLYIVFKIWFRKLFGKLISFFMEKIISDNITSSRFVFTLWKSSAFFVFFHWHKVLESMRLEKFFNNFLASLFLKEIILAKQSKQWCRAIKLESQKK